MKLNWITKLFPLALLTIGLASLSLAQNAGPTGGKLAPGRSQSGARRPILDALEKLNLTPPQKAQIKTLEKTRNDDMKAFRQAHKGDRDAIRAHEKEATQTFLTGIKGVLTVPQWDQFLAELKSMRGKGKGAGAGTAPGAGAGSGTGSGAGAKP